MKICHIGIDLSRDFNPNDYGIRITFFFKHELYWVYKHLRVKFFENKKTPNLVQNWKVKPKDQFIEKKS